MHNDTPEPDSGHPDNDLWQCALNWLIALNDRPDDPELAAKFAAWLSESAEHPEIFNEAQRVWELTGMIEPEKPEG